MTPDWKNPADYEYTAKFNGNPAAWAWEFLRRNEEYKKDFVDLKSGKNQGLVYRPPKKTNESDEQWQQRCIFNDVEPRKIALEQHLAERWGLLFYMYDPALNALELKESGFEVEFNTGIAPLIIKKWDDINKVPVEEVTDGMVVVSPNKLLVSFDLSSPMTPQIELVKIRAKEAKKLSSPPTDAKSGNKKPKSPIFLSCIRALDAMAEGIAPHAIAKVLFADDNAAQNVKIHDCIETAKTNRDSAYRAIARRRTEITNI